MLAPWLNITVKVQRRNAPSVVGMNALNEPNYGVDSSLPIVYADIWTRIEYNEFDLLYTETGERINPGAGTYMFVDSDIILMPQDRVTILTSDNPDVVGAVYIIKEVYGEWDSVGNLHHRVAQLQIH